MEALANLLEYLDSNPEIAGEKYVDERLKLVRFFEQNGVNSSEELADTTLDRVAQKLSAGEKIENIGGYSYTVAGFVLREYRKKAAKTEPLTVEEIDASKLAAGDQENAEKELRLSCLDDCLERLPPETHELIIEYYNPDGRHRAENRQALADRLGIKRMALSNRAQRLREKLEKCIEDCYKRKTAAAIKLAT